MLNFLAIIPSNISVMPKRAYATVKVRYILSEIKMNKIGSNTILDTERMFGIVMYSFLNIAVPP
jgi:transcription antitermination factor NusG